MIDAPIVAYFGLISGDENFLDVRLGQARLEIVAARQVLC
jgi:hypothetical protein